MNPATDRHSAVVDRLGGVLLFYVEKALERLTSPPTAGHEIRLVQQFTLTKCVESRVRWRAPFTGAMLLYAHSPLSDQTQSAAEFEP